MHTQTLTAKKILPLVKKATAIIVYAPVFDACVKVDKKTARATLNLLLDIEFSVYTHSDGTLQIEKANP